ncbi:hypothetical protein SteCoe_25105 [Stentor coeruleus]|uniref:Potassium channel domain-containing protein n=1 Tax=Stentor coeruleus TaxID=5963 RepID=A0A1R2BFY0_9CILI|nr:hypothetical protein SteCoe_25105 [Stentor coeruleus]
MANTKTAVIDASRGKNIFHRNSVASIRLIEDFVIKHTNIDIYSSSDSDNSVDDTISLKSNSASKKKELRIKTLQSKKTRCEDLEYKLKILDTTIAFLAISGVVLAIQDFESNYSDNKDERYLQSSLTNKFRIYISFTTIISIILAVVRSITSYNLKRERKMFLEDKIKSYFFTSSFPLLVVEILLVSVHCPPYLDHEFEFKQLSGVLYVNFSSICLSIMTLRVILLLRLISHYSKWATVDVQIICRENDVNRPLNFALKAILKDMPQLLLLPGFAISTVALGVALQVYERPFNEDNYMSSTTNCGGESEITTSTLDYTFLYNAEWLVLLTMTTVGFGDFYPRTHMGRLIAIIAAIWGTFLISLMIIMFNNFVSFSRGEEKCYKLLKKIIESRELREYAKKFIKASIEAHLYKKNHKLSPNDPLLAMRIAQINHYKKMYKEKVLDVKFRNNDIREVLIELNQSFSMDLEKLKKIVANAQEMENQLDVLLESQKKTLEVLLSCSKFSRDVENMMVFSQGGLR